MRELPDTEDKSYVPPHTAKERELLYDQHVAPILLELGKFCAQNGLSFAAAVEWNSDDSSIGGTACVSNSSSYRMKRIAFLVSVGDDMKITASDFVTPVKYRGVP